MSKDNQHTHPSHLSFSQKRMWFIEQSSTKNKGYQIPIALTLYGRLDLQILERAIGYTISRHDILTNSQLSKNTPNFKLDIENTSTHWSERLELANKFSLNHISIHNTSLFKIKLYRFDDKHHVLSMNIHHIICDGWSLNILLKEISNHYNTLKNGTNETTLSPPKSSFTDFVKFELNYYNSQKFELDREYWVKDIRNSKKLNLPKKPKLNNIKSKDLFSSKTLTETLDNSSTKTLEILASEKKSSLFSVLFSAYIILLSRITNEHDIVVGTPFANRTDKRFEDVIGLFVNTLLLRISVEDNPSTENLLKRVRKKLLNALKHQSFPFDKLVDELSPERSLGSNPLFNTMFILQDSSKPLNFDGIDTERLDVNDNTSRFDLEVKTWRTDTGLKIRCSYLDDSISDITAQRILKDYVQILKLLPVNLNLNVFEFPRTLPKTLTNDGLANNKKISIDLRRTLHECLRQKYIEHPNIDAVSTKNKSISYSELYNRANQLAGRIKSLNPKPSEYIALCTEKNEYLAIGLFGILMAGCAFVPIAESDPKSRRHHIINDSKIKIAIISSQKLELLFSDSDINCINILEPGSPLPEPGGNLSSPDEVAYALYTSGTTGKPKGVKIQHSNIVNTIYGCQHTYGFNYEDCFLACSYQTFDIFYFELLSGILCCGGTRILSKEELEDKNKLAQAINSITCFQAVPSLMEQILSSAQKTTKIKHPRIIFTGGERVPPQLIYKIKDVFKGSRVAILYGPTETTMVCTGYEFSDPKEAKSYPIGTPLPNVSITILKNGRAAPSEIHGEIVIGGKGVAKGYINLPIEEKKCFEITNGQRVYHTGDIGYWSSDGTIHYVGRDDQQIKLRGFRIELLEIANALSTHPLIEQTVVRPIDIDKNTARLVAFVTPTDLFYSNYQAQNGYRDHWKEVFELSYRNTNNTTIKADYSGWISSYTGKPIPKIEMDEWVNNTVSRIRKLFKTSQPSAEVTKILEIGCGTGLILSKLANDCEKYVGTDFSPSVIEQLKNRVDYLGLNDTVDLYCLDGNDTLELIEGNFDLIIINSVTQYMSSPDSVKTLLLNTQSKVTDSGKVFIGDVRHLGLQKLFRSELVKLDNSFENTEDQQNELLLDPYFFYDFIKNSTYGHVSIEPKLGTYHNELNRYRYDVTLWKKSPAIIEPNHVMDYSIELASEYNLTQNLAAKYFGGLLVKNIPHIYLTEINNEIDSCEGHQSKLSQNIEPLSPQQIKILAQANNLHVEIDWSCSTPLGNINAYFTHNINESVIEWPYNQTKNTANNPEKSRRLRQLQSISHQFSKEILPHYMQPSEFVALKTMPLNSNGKINFSKLKPSVSKFYSAINKPITPLEKTIHSIFSKVLGNNNFGIKDNFFKIGGNSLLSIQVAVEMETKNLNINPQDLFVFQTIDELTTFIESGPSASQVTSIKEKKNDASHQPSILKGLQSTDRVITGATGFLGAHCCQQLLSEPGIKSITCLVRGSDEKEARDHLQSRLAFYFGNTTEEMLKKIQVIPSDIRQDKLGLNSSDWRFLSKNHNSTFHTAADVRHVAEPSDVFATNLQGTRNIIEFSRQNINHELFHISTIGVKGINPKSNINFFNENDLDIGQSFSEAYSQSKYDAEKELNEFIVQEGGNCKIFRVGTIAAHATSGIFQANTKDHFFTRYMNAIITFGIIGDWPDRFFSLTPVNAMADAIIKLCKLQTSSHTFHVNSPHKITHRELGQLLSSCGYNIDIVTPEEFNKSVLDHTLDPTKMDAIGSVLPLLKAKKPHYVSLNCDRTNEHLKSVGFEYPTPTVCWFKKYLEFCQSVGAIPYQSLG